MRAMAYQITSLTIVYSTVYSRHRSKKTSKLRVTDLCAGSSPVTGDFPAQGSVTQKMFPFDVVIMQSLVHGCVTPFVIQLEFRLTPQLFRVLDCLCGDMGVSFYRKCSGMLIKVNINALEPPLLHIICHYKYVDWPVMKSMFQITRLNSNLIFIQFVFFLYQIPFMMSIWRQ